MKEIFMLYPILAIIFGILLLVVSADRFILGAGSIATHFKIPSILIGIVIIGFGTSAPELLVSMISAYQGNPDLALGNAYGSNIGNIGLILGLSILLKPMFINTALLKREIPLLWVIFALSLYLGFDFKIDQKDAYFLMIAFVIMLVLINILTLKNNQATTDKDIEQIPIGLSWVYLIIGLVAMLAASKLLVWGAVDIAKYYQVSDLVIGLTVVAIGTSLPELASALIAVKKGENDLAMGNIIGSNLFNSTMVIGATAYIQPIQISHDIAYRDFPMNLLMTLLLTLFMVPIAGKTHINRLSGFSLLIVYLMYNAYLLYPSI
jgi:cation:H+ antiporter